MNKLSCGAILMRAQPFHWGHQHIINEILLDGRIPIILLVDDQGANPGRNPLTFKERKELIKLVYPHENIIFQKVYDDENWTMWFTTIEAMAPKTDTVMYFNNKEQDRYSEFECCGKKYKNTFYTDIFGEEGYKTKQIEFATRSDIHIDADATNIRDNFEAFKHLLDARVYRKLKEWKW